MKFNRKNVRKALDELAEEAVDALSVVGQANWPERVRDSEAAIQRKCDKLIAALCPDKPAPKVYTEDELEPVGTPVVKGDFVALIRDGGMIWSSETNKGYEVVGILPSGSADIGDGSAIDPSWLRQGLWRILKRPLRDVFKDPRVGDVVEFGPTAHDTIKFVDDRMVASINAEGRPYVWTRAGFADFACMSHAKVISRAESK